MSLPYDAWNKVMRWLNDFIRIASDRSEKSDMVVFLDCNPSFSIYTQIALAACERLIIPYTADDSSRRGIENVFALLFGITANELQGYAKLSFSKKASEEGVPTPRIHTFVSNRVTMYKGKPSSAFEAKSAPIKQLAEEAALAHKKHFVSHIKFENLFAEMPDYHSVAVVASSEGCPLSKLISGHHTIDGDTIQVNQTSINKYKAAIKKLSSRL
jgi:cellulose biosynthesis protein BcsQ